jgi:hypothetical protein
LILLGGFSETEKNEAMNYLDRITENLCDRKDQNTEEAV